MDWKEIKSALEKREKEIRRWGKEKRKHPIWDEFFGIEQLICAVENKIKEKVNVEKGVAYCPGIGCRSSLDFTYLTPPKCCPLCGQALDWSDVLVCLPEVECDNSEDIVKILFHKDGKYSEDVRVKVGEEVAIISRGEWIKVKRKIKEALDNFFYNHRPNNETEVGCWMEKKETSAEVSDHSQRGIAVAEPREAQSTTGTKIKEIRKKVGITQSSIAKRLGIDRSAIAKWETGKAEPKVNQLPKIAEVLGCEIADLFGNPSVSAEPSQLPLDKGAFVEVADATSDTCGKADA